MAARSSSHTLRLLGAELKLQSMDKNNASAECKKLLSYIMSVAGDCRLMMSHASSTEDIERFRDELQVVDGIDLEIQKVIDGIGIEENSAGEPSCFFSLMLDRQRLFDCRIHLGLGADSRDRTESIGQCARLRVRHVHCAASWRARETTSSPADQTLWKRAQRNRSALDESMCSSSEENRASPGEGTIGNESKRTSLPLFTRKSKISFGRASRVSMPVFKHSRRSATCPTSPCYTRISVV